MSLHFKREEQYILHTNTSGEAMSRWEIEGMRTSSRRSSEPSYGHNKQREIQTAI